MKKAIDYILGGMFLWYGVAGICWGILIVLVPIKISFLWPTGLIVLAVISMVYSIFKR